MSNISVTPQTNSVNRRPNFSRCGRYNYSEFDLRLGSAVFDYVAAHTTGVELGELPKQLGLSRSLAEDAVRMLVNHREATIDGSLAGLVLRLEATVRPAPPDA